MRVTSTTPAGGCIVLVLSVALGLIVSSVVVGGVGAVFLEVPYRYGFHRAWERWGWLLAFWILIVSGNSARNK